MDTSPAAPSWTDSTLFSPSKARAQQAQAASWSSVDAWLSKKYASKRLPPFERNEETLQPLLTLATINDSVDEQRNLIDRVEKAALQALSRRRASLSPGGNAEDDGVGMLMKDLGGNEVLDALAETAVCLDCPDVEVGRMAKAIVDLTDQRFAAEQQVQRTNVQLRTLNAEQDKVEQLLVDLKREDFQPPSGLVEQTPEWIRNTKQLKAKVGEYDDRLKVLNALQQPTVRLEDVKQTAQDLSAQQERMAELNAALAAFQSLPSDAKGARTKVEGAREELRGLVKERDQLFESLVDDG